MLLWHWLLAYSVSIFGSRGNRTHVLAIVLTAAASTNLPTLVTRFVQYFATLHNFEYLWQILRVCLVFGRILNLLWQKCFAIWQMFIALKGQKIRDSRRKFPTWVFGVHPEVLEPPGEILEDGVVVEKCGEASVDDLRRHGAVRADVGEQEAGAKMRILLLDFWGKNENTKLIQLNFRYATVVVKSD